MNSMPPGIAGDQRAPASAGAHQQGERDEEQTQQSLDRARAAKLGRRRRAPGEAGEPHAETSRRSLLSSSVVVAKA